MKKSQIIKELNQHYPRYLDYLDSLSENELQIAKPEKWNAVTQLQHMVLSTKPLAQVLIIPALLFPILFGRANRKSKSYDELVAKYQSKLSEGGKAKGRYAPNNIGLDKYFGLRKSLANNIKFISNRLGKFSESDLDNLILPHPLLGRVTLREMMYFTIYHVQHHQKLTAENLK